MKKSIILLGICLILFAAAAQGQGRRLTILHVNDTHSHLEAVREGDGPQSGGVIERAAFVDSVRRADGKKNVLLLHAGDFSQGTSYFTELGGDIEIEVMNALGYDVVTLGNHEFDNGIEELARRLKSLKAPVVCCNYDFSPFELGDYVKPYTIVRKAGKKIGVIGILTDISSVVAKPIADRLPHLDGVAEMNKWADYLKNEERCDLVIALSHLGYGLGPGSDTALVEKTRNIDIVVGGHSHTFLEKMEYATNLDGERIPIVQDGCWGLYVGEIKVAF